MLTFESAVLSAWYRAHPEIRRLVAIRDTEGLRVLVQLEPTNDSSDTYPAWIANCDDWINELQLHTGAAIRLEHAHELFPNEVENREVIVADVFWRDCSLI